MILRKTSFSSLQATLHTVSPGDDGPTARVRLAITFFHRLGLDPGGVVAKEELLALSLSPDYRLECDICDRDYMLRRGCP